MSTILQFTIMVFGGIIVLICVIEALLNLVSAIVNYGKPELFCQKCGKRVTAKQLKCNKCKAKLKS